MCYDLLECSWVASQFILYVKDFTASYVQIRPYLAHLCILAWQAMKVGMSEAERMVHAILGTMEALDQNVNTRAALEVLMLDVPTINT